MMQRCAVGIVLALSLGLVGCASSSQYMVKTDAPTAGPPPDKALVYVLRPSGMGFAINFQIWDRDQFVGLSQAKSYFAHLCAPGKHLFIGIAENKVAVEADLAPGKSYYILTGPRIGGWRARLAMDAVTQGSESWGTIESLKKDLEFIVPVAEHVQTWDAAKKAEAAALVEFFEKNPEREKYMTRLTPADGR